MRHLIFMTHDSHKAARQGNRSIMQEDQSMADSDEGKVKKTGSSEQGRLVTGSQGGGRTNRNVEKAKKIIRERARKKEK